MTTEKLKDWREMLPAARAIYAKHGAGCHWHIALDDGNLDDDDVDFCAMAALGDGCAHCMALTPLARRASSTQLRKLIAAVHGAKG